MTPAKIFVVMLCAASAFAQVSNPCDPRYHLIAPPNCTTISQQMMNGVVELRRKIAEENVN